MEERSDRFTAIEDQYAGYTVVDESGSKIGKVDDLFLDESDQPEYFGVKMGFLGTSSTLIPADITTIDNEQGFIEVSQTKDTVKNGPAFDDDREITPEYENEVRSYYGLGSIDSAEDRGNYGDYDGEHSGAGTTSDIEDEDELRVQRSEEELRAGTSEREAGAMKVRKRVRTDREQIEVPTKHEEVTVERVPIEGEATEAQIGEDEVTVPVTEEEVVVDKRAVAKEEIRLRKDVVEDTEVVEEDVRREEIDVEDATERGSGTRV
ncbi:MAG: PRC and DUF2382 domain-containing protein [Actinomycetota bacterium]|nr:PRC and DUF2382 domain-containing protein [Actinomycetota bacterium]